MHDLFEHALAILSAVGTSAAPAAPSSTGDSSTVKVAIVTAIGLVVAAAITAFASTLKRTPSPTGTANQNEVFTRQYIQGLEKDRRELTKLRATHARLREGCFQHNLDPDDLIREQETP